MSMQSFKQYLTEAPDFASKAEKFADLKKLISNCNATVLYSESSKGLVIKNNIKLTDEVFFYAKLDEMPQGLISCERNFEYIDRATNLTSCKNFPKHVGGTFWLIAKTLTDLRGCPEEVDGEECFISGGFSSLEGITRYVNNGQMTITSPNLTSLKDIHKHISFVEDRLDVNAPIRSNILGLLKIKGIRTLGLEVRNYPHYDECNEAFGIIKKHLRRGRDIVACQRELIENDLDEYAEL